MQRGVDTMGECALLTRLGTPSFTYDLRLTFPALPSYAYTFEFLADAAPVDAIPPASQSQQWPRPADAWAANTLLADRAPSQIAMGCTTLVAYANGWDQMAERQRAAENDGLCLGLDAANLAGLSAGNAVVTQVAEWIGRKLIGSG